MEVFRVTVFPSVALSALLFLLALALQGRARSAVLVSAKVAALVVLAAWSLYLPNSA